jgi:hypothetical protein
MRIASSEAQSSQREATTNSPAGGNRSVRISGAAKGAIGAGVVLIFCQFLCRFIRTLPGWRNGIRGGLKILCP